MPFGRGWFGRGYGMGRGVGFGRGFGMGTGMGFGRGFGMGRGNPYPFCRFNPSLPRRWWAYGRGYYPPAATAGYGQYPYYGPPGPLHPGW